MDENCLVKEVPAKTDHLPCKEDRNCAAAETLRGKVDSQGCIELFWLLRKVLDVSPAVCQSPLRSIVRKSRLTFALLYSFLCICRLKVSAS